MLSEQWYYSRLSSEFTPPSRHSTYYSLGCISSRSHTSPSNHICDSRRRCGQPNERGTRDQNAFSPRGASSPASGVLDQLECPTRSTPKPISTATSRIRAALRPNLPVGLSTLTLWGTPVLPRPSQDSPSQPATGLSLTSSRHGGFPLAESGTGGLRSNENQLARYQRSSLVAPNLRPGLPWTLLLPSPLPRLPRCGGRKVGRAIIVFGIADEQYRVPRTRHSGSFMAYRACPVCRVGDPPWPYSC